MNPSALLECLYLEALGVRVSLWDLLVTLGGPPPRRLGAARIIEWRLVIVSGSDRGDCEGFLTFLRWRAKRYSSKLAREPPSEWITTMRTSLPASK